MHIIKKKSLWFSISGALILGSILIYIALGVRLGIDFTGGSLLQLEYQNTERPTQTQVVEALAAHSITPTVSTVGDLGFNLRFQDIDEQMHQEVLSTLSELAGEGEMVELQFTTIGPVVGQELARNSLTAVWVVLVAIIIYIAYAFRKVSFPVRSWKYGIVAVGTLFHDIVITIGIFVALSYVTGWEINTPFVAALLTILGYSVNDTIVIFDRIRENLNRLSGSFEDVVEQSVQETIPRSINTSITTLIVLGAIFLFGGASVQPFVATLMIGIAFGTYSSIFIASPLLVAWQQIEWKLTSAK
jgi:preprotein translocase subunit SecF